MNGKKSVKEIHVSRRQLLLGAFAALLGGSGIGLYVQKRTDLKARVFIGRAESYSKGLKNTILSGFSELGISPKEIGGKRILLKPNLVEAGPGIHRTTHPLVIQAAADAFRSLGAQEVFVAEGSGHNTDTLQILDETGQTDMMTRAGLNFVDLNFDDIYNQVNESRFTRLPSLVLPVALKRADWVVSIPKMKTHHWAGITASMKNLFGVMPGSYYGWPKNVLHFAGIRGVILDINHAVKPDFAIVDGIVGMEGDGPILGTPKRANVLVMGRSLTAVDDTCARIMDLLPGRIPYLNAAKQITGLLREDNIGQVGERIASVKTRFQLLEKIIPAHRGLRHPIKKKG